MSGDNGTIDNVTEEGLDHSEELGGPDVVVLEDEEGNTLEDVRLSLGTGGWEEVDAADNILHTKPNEEEDKAREQDLRKAR